MITLRRQPEAFQTLATGEIEETFAIDGWGFRFGLGESIIHAPAFDIRVVKTADHELRQLRLGLRYLPAAMVALINARLAQIDNIDAMGSRALLVALRLRQEVLDTVFRPQFQAIATIEALLDLRDADGEPVLFDLANYTVEQARL